MGVSASKVASYSCEFSDSISQSNYQNYQKQTSNQQMDDSKITVRSLKNRTVRKKKGFGTFRRKFIRKRKATKLPDHVRIIRDLISTWTPLEMKLLLDEYETLAALKDLTIQAELARPPAATFKQDLANLFDSQFCSDTELIYRGVCFPIHRAILSVRCPYFRDLLAEYPNFGARIRLELETASVDVKLFSIILKYLYTGNLSQSSSNDQQDLDFTILRRLGDEFNTPNSLENDLEYLLEYGNFSDAILVFTSENQNCLKSDSSNSEYGFRPKLELRCHKAILSARSLFFHNLILRRSRIDDNNPCDHRITIGSHHHCNQNITKIVLDESVIPKRFARVLLHAIYLDTVDLSLIYQSNEFTDTKQNTNGPNNNTANTHSNESGVNRNRPSLLDEAMELYQIGRFLELDILSQGCEDLIVDWISVDTLLSILHWSGQPHGSDWVHRQTLHFLREEFPILHQSSVLNLLQKNDLIEILDSHFVQASELEILQSIIKWSENELIRQMDEREPNLVSSTSHSAANKKSKKRDINDMELRDILSNFLPLVRIEHIIPQNNENLLQIIKRGLISAPMNYMISNENVRNNIIKLNPWIRKNNECMYFKRPRLFAPYHDTLKMIYANQQPNLESIYSCEMNHLFCHNVPDTLYMVDNGYNFDNNCSRNCPHYYHHRHNHNLYCYQFDNDDETTDDVQSVKNNYQDLSLIQFNDNDFNMLSIPNEKTLNAMIKRLHKLYKTTSCQRALALTQSSKTEIKLQIKLRVVREFNMPDQIVSILDYHYKKYINQDSDKSQNSKIQTENSIFEQINDVNVIADVCDVDGNSTTHYSNSLPNNSNSDNNHLPDLMSDVTIATASVNQLQIRDQSEVSLDLGDRVHSSINLENHQTTVSSNNNHISTSRFNQLISSRYTTFRFHSNSNSNNQFLF